MFYISISLWPSYYYTFKLLQKLFSFSYFLFFTISPIPLAKSKHFLGLFIILFLHLILEYYNYVIAGCTYHCSVFTLTHCCPFPSNWMNVLYALFHILIALKRNKRLDRRSVKRGELLSQFLDFWLAIAVIRYFRTDSNSPQPILFHNRTHTLRHSQIFKNNKSHSIILIEITHFTKAAIKRVHF